MCEFHGSNGNGFGDIWWTDNPIYFSSIDNTLFSRKEIFAKSEFEIFSREDIFANIGPTVHAEISSRENFFSRKYFPAKISCQELFPCRKYVGY